VTNKSDWTQIFRISWLQAARRYFGLICIHLADLRPIGFILRSAGAASSPGSIHQPGSISIEQ
jgi:hypothetical protein